MSPSHLAKCKCTAYLSGNKLTSTTLLSAAMPESIMRADEVTSSPQAAMIAGPIPSAMEVVRGSEQFCISFHSTFVGLGKSVIVLSAKFQACMTCPM